MTQRPTAWLIAPKVDPQPTTASFPLVFPCGDVLRRDVVGDAIDLGGTDLGHPVMIVTVIGNMTAVVILLDAADTMHQPGCAGNGPVPCQRLFVAQIGMEPFWVGAEIDREISDGVGVRNFPWLRRICEEAVGKQDNRRHVFRGQPHGFDRSFEAVTGST